MPIFNQRQLKGALHGAEVDYNEAVTNYDAAVSHALQDAANVVVIHRALQAHLVNSRCAVQQAYIAYEVAMRRSKGGLKYARAFQR